MQCKNVTTHIQTSKPYTRQQNRINIYQQRIQSKIKLNVTESLVLPLSESIKNFEVVAAFSLFSIWIMEVRSDVKRLLVMLVLLRYFSRCCSSVALRWWWSRALLQCCCKGLCLSCEKELVFVRLWWLGFWRRLCRGVGWRKWKVDGGD